MLFKEKFIPRVKISEVKEINISADQLVSNLLELSKTETVCLLDSCGVEHLDSHLLIAGIKPLETLEISDIDSVRTLELFDSKISQDNFSFFTVSYDFGLKLENIKITQRQEISNFEPDIFLTTFDCVIIHDYKKSKTYVKGNKNKFDSICRAVLRVKKANNNKANNKNINFKSNFTRAEYIQKVNDIKEWIRKGDTYQTNLTQQFQVKCPDGFSAQSIFHNLREKHPAPFASFIKRQNDYVVSISPERLIHLDRDNNLIKTSPIKGTRPRGFTKAEDLKLKNELLQSEKDRAENTMIVDLLRNDLGRICEFGTVKVEKLCDLEEHPTLFHLVSTVSGTLKQNINFAEIIKAVFPCGSITGCPKIRTMEIIDELETADRGLSMGAIGYCGFDNSFDLNVAIRTMTINADLVTFNVGGGIVIDSDPSEEYEESLLKAKALFNAIGIKSLE